MNRIGLMAGALTVASVLYQGLDGSKAYLDQFRRNMVATVYLLKRGRAGRDLKAVSSASDARRFQHTASVLAYPGVLRAGG